MGGGNTASTLPTRLPPQAPPSGAQSPGEAKPTPRRMTFALVRFFEFPKFEGTPSRPLHFGMWLSLGSKRRPLRNAPEGEGGT